MTNRTEAAMERKELVVEGNPQVGSKESFFVLLDGTT